MARAVNWRCFLKAAVATRQRRLRPRGTLRTWWCTRPQLLLSRVAAATAISSRISRLAAAAVVATLQYSSCSPMAYRHTFTRSTPLRIPSTYLHRHLPWRHHFKRHCLQTTSQPSPQHDQTTLPPPLPHQYTPQWRTPCCAAVPPFLQQPSATARITGSRATHERPSFSHTRILCATSSCRGSTLQRLGTRHAGVWCIKPSRRYACRCLVKRGRPAARRDRARSTFIRMAS